MLQRSFPYLVWLELRAYLVSSTLSNAIAIECSSLYISKMTTYLTANPYRPKKEPSTRRKERLELGLSEGCIEEDGVRGFWCRPCGCWLVDNSPHWHRIVLDHLVGKKHHRSRKNGSKTKQILMQPQAVQIRPSVRQLKHRRKLMKAKVS